MTGVLAVLGGFIISSTWPADPGIAVATAVGIGVLAGVLTRYKMLLRRLDEEDDDKCSMAQERAIHVITEIVRGIDMYLRDDTSCVTREETNGSCEPVADTSTPNPSLARVCSQESLVLSPDQELALQQIEAAFEHGMSVAVLAGPAGTGKTTLMRAFLKTRSGVVLLAPTGKAALRLKTATGMSTSTIHRFIYGVPVETEVWKRATLPGSAETRMIAQPADGESSETYETDKRQASADGFEFSGEVRPVFKYRGVDEEMASPSLIVVDESSMVNTQVFQDLRSAASKFDCPILFVGDREQLPPVEDSWGPDFSHPTAVLTEIHRQAQGNPIIQAATQIRLQGTLPHPSGDSRYSAMSTTLENAARWFFERAHDDAILLTYTNATRTKVNTLVRQLLGFSGPLAVGDQIVALINRGDVRNGEIMSVVSMRPSKLWEGAQATMVTFAGESGVSVTFKVDMDLIGQDASVFRTKIKTFKSRAERDLWLHIDFGYCLTCHKAQGSQWKHVAILWDGAVAAMMRRESFKGDKKNGVRWLYTACTRASETLTIMAVT